MAAKRLLGDSVPDFFFFFLFVVTTVRFFSLFHAVFTLILSNLFACYFILPPHDSVLILPSDVPKLLTFNLVSVMMLFLLDRLQKSKQHAEKQYTEAMAESTRAIFLARASDALAMCSDESEICTTITRLSINKLCDWCIVHLVDDSHNVRVAVSNHRSPTLRSAARALTGYSLDFHSSQRIPAAIRRCYVDCSRTETDGSLKDGINDPTQIAHLDLLGSKAFLILPLPSKHGSFGAITMVRSSDFNQQDLGLAKEFATRCSRIIANSSARVRAFFIHP